jgi:ppGpp synthetase/RelA/SpoT-type nucleotidyltranferase
MKIVEDFIKQYNKEFDFFQKLSQIVANKIENQLYYRGIKAIVTSRAKKPDRLREKLLKRHSEKRYNSQEEIYQDIYDLAGVRVSLYFPTERDIVNEIIADLFEINKQMEFPCTSHVPKYTKRFSGYWATHYRITLKGDGLTNRYTNTIVEIQVSSILMHAWAEVEHDLVYKPYSGDLSTEEIAILDELNGLVLSGEIALEQLQLAMAKRTKKRNIITDKYLLTNYLLNTVDKSCLNKIRLGDTYLLNNYLSTSKKFSIKDLDLLIDKLNINSDETVADQLLNMLIVRFFDSDRMNLLNYFKNLHIPDKKAADFELFIKCWSILENATHTFLPDYDPESDSFQTPDFEIFNQLEVLRAEEINQLKQLNQIKRNLLHGLDTQTENYLASNYQLLKIITEKVVAKVSVEPAKNKLQEELGHI